MPTPLDPVRAVLREHAHQILAAAARAGRSVDDPVAMSASDDLLTVTILLAPAGAKTGRPLSPCEADVLTLLEASPVRLSRARIASGLTRLGRHHGESTIGRALTRLVRLGLVLSSRRAPRGYHLPGKTYRLFSDPPKS